MSFLKISCPRCSLQCKLSLETPASMLLLNCPKCKAPLMHFKRKTFDVDKAQIKEMIEKEKLQTVQDLLNVLSRQNRRLKKRQVIPFSPKYVKPKSPLKKVSKTVSGEKQRNRTIPIERDDILNLVIDLNTSDSVTEFLKRIE